MDDRPVEWATHPGLPGAFPVSALPPSQANLGGLVALQQVQEGLDYEVPLSRKAVEAHSHVVLEVEWKEAHTRPTKQIPSARGL